MDGSENRGTVGQDMGSEKTGKELVYDWVTQIAEKKISLKIIAP
jgi:hypothetical protein